MGRSGHGLKLLHPKNLKDMTESLKQKLNNGLLTVIFVLLAWIAAGVGWLIKVGNERIDLLNTVDQETQKQFNKHDNEIKFIARVQWLDPDTRLDDKYMLQEMAKLDLRGK